MVSGLDTSDNMVDKPVMDTATGAGGGIMKKLLWIGNKYFSGDLAQLGWEVVSQPMTSPIPLDWSDLVRINKGTAPDVLILSDQSISAPLVGLESFPCLTVFHCIDSHIHSWYPTYAQAFDLCAVSLKDHRPEFVSRLGENQVIWLPPFAHDDDRPLDLPKEWDIVFVGHINKETTPGRAIYMERLKERLPGLQLMTGNYRELFARARLVLNYAERGDLNFRVFEALGCGACLITPEVGHGQAELFEDDRDFLLYDQDNMSGLIEVVNRALLRPEHCREIALSGLAKVDQGHRARHRAARMDAWIKSMPVTEMVTDRLAQARDLHHRYLKLIYLHLAENLDNMELRRIYLKAATA